MAENNYDIGRRISRDAVDQKIIDDAMRVVHGLIHQAAIRNLVHRMRETADERNRLEDRVAELEAIVDKLSKDQSQCR